MESSTTDIAPSTEEAVAAFFTPERRQYYRDLHSRYQLWSGDWEAIDRPETYRWDPNFRLRVEAQRLVPDANWAFIEYSWAMLHSKYPPVPRLFVVDLDPSKGTFSDRTIPIDRSVEAGLISAIIYTGWRWRKGRDLVGGQRFASKVKVLERWADRLAHIMTRPDYRVVGHEAEPGPTGWYLFLLREQYLITRASERRKREKLRNQASEQEKREKLREQAAEREKRKTKQRTARLLVVDRQRCRVFTTCRGWSRNDAARLAPRAVGD